jgi:hypothetical protein
MNAGSAFVWGAVAGAGSAIVVVLLAWWNDRRRW